MKFTAAEEAQIDAFMREHGARRCPRINPLSTLSVVPRRGRGGAQVTRNRQTMADAIRLPDQGVSPAT